MQGFITNVIYVVFPMLLYFVLVAHNKTFNKNNKSLLEITLLFTLFLLFYCGNNIYKYNAFYIYNVPLLLAYLKKRNSTALLMTIIVIINNIITPLYSTPLIILNYICNFLLYKVDKKYFKYTYPLLNIIFLFILNKFDVDYLIVIFAYIMTINFVLKLFDYVENTMHFYMTLKEIENNKQLQDSLFKISHEIKNPIAVCKGYLELMDGTLKTYQKYVPIITKEINHSLLILKDFSSIGKLKIEKDVMDIVLLIEEIEEEFRNILVENNIDINITCNEEEIYIMGDYTRLKEVFINIIRNAIDALKDRPNPLIRIVVEARKDRVYIKIVDNGCGVDEETLKRIEEPFFTTKKDGTGLGTYLSKEIIEGHGGKLTFYAKKDKGMQVSIKLGILQLEKDFN